MLGLVVHIAAQIKFATYYVFEPRHRRFFREVQGTVHIAVVGHTNGVDSVVFAVID